MTILYLNVPIGEYGTIKVEIEPTNDTSGFEDLGIDKNEIDAKHGFEHLGFKENIKTITAKAINAFDKTASTIQTVAYGFRDCMEHLGEKVKPDEASVEFGLNIRVDAGVVVARTGTEANFKIKLTWKA